MLGTKYDQWRQETYQQKDDATQRIDVELAQKWLYKDGTAITSVYIDRLLGPKSLVPTWVGPFSFTACVNSNLSQNAFSEKLGPYRFDFYSLFVPDLLHKFEVFTLPLVFHMDPHGIPWNPLIQGHQFFGVLWLHHSAWIHME